MPGCQRATHPITADAKVSVTELDRLLRCDHWLTALAVVNLRVHGSRPQRGKNLGWHIGWTALQNLHHAADGVFSIPECSCKARGVVQEADGGLLGLVSAASMHSWLPAALGKEKSNDPHQDKVIAKALVLHKGDALPIHLLLLCCCCGCCHRPHTQRNTAIAAPAG